MHKVWLGNSSVWSGVKKRGHKILRERAPFGPVGTKVRPEIPPRDGSLTVRFIPATKSRAGLSY
jgi:hypothetical protein